MTTVRWVNDEMHRAPRAVAVSPAQTSARRATSATAKQDKRWSARRTLAFAVGASLAGWGVLAVAAVGIAAAVS